ncbi:ISPsy1 transposase [mine drainage metagenome]|uniref:ISPsy1 transposase n=1 Tax=mine drainage metagenome TaxID=410659 RepID=T1A5I3_9ZZZZ
MVCGATALPRALHADLRLLAQPGGAVLRTDQRKMDQAQCTHTSVADLEQSIRNDIDTHNADPKPFVWRKTADAILASMVRAATKLI